jgi:hypothetical protein
LGIWVTPQALAANPKHPETLKIMRRMQAVVRSQQQAVGAAFDKKGHVGVGALAKLLRQLSGTSARDVMLVVCRVLDMDLSGNRYNRKPTPGDLTVSHPRWSIGGVCVLERNRTSPGLHRAKLALMSFHGTRMRLPSDLDESGARC